MRWMWTSPADLIRTASPGPASACCSRHAVQGGLRDHDLAGLRQVVQMRDKVDIVAENIFPLRGFDAQTIAEMQAEAKPQSGRSAPARCATGSVSNAQSANHRRRSRTRRESRRR